MNRSDVISYLGLYNKSVDSGVRILSTFLIFATFLTVRLKPEWMPPFAGICSKIDIHPILYYSQFMSLTSEDCTFFDLGYCIYDISFDTNKEISCAVLIVINKRYREISGLDLQAGDSIDLTGDDWTLRLKLYRQMIDNQDFSPITEYFYRSGCWSSTSVRRREDGYYYVVLTDITKLYNTVGQYEMQETSYKFFLENIQGIAFQIKSDRGKIDTFLTGAYEELTGYPVDTVKTIESHLAIIHPNDLPQVKDYNKKLYESPNISQQIEYRIITKEGQVKWLRSYDRNVAKKDGYKLVQGIMFDITESKEQELELNKAYQVIAEQNDKLEKLSRTDPLTKLNNRRAFIHQLEIELARKDRFTNQFSILMIDLDHFKKINDTYGHDMGDKVLVSVAKIFRESLRTIDIPARWGGEEFIILLVNTKPDKAKIVADKLRIKFNEVTFNGPHGELFSVSFSCGIAGHRESEKYEQLLIRADEALYRAKEKGRNYVESSE